jgi:predicted Rossmann-fold nucleotide-binding protein
VTVDIRSSRVRPRKAPVIAVFGPNSATDDDLASSRRLGTAIAERGYILLTGGTGDVHQVLAKTVKDCAIAGAEQAAQSRSSVRWVGVANSKKPERARKSATGHGLVLTPGYGHKRNFLEAHLCDAAIALHGRHADEATADRFSGTVSEVAFCLALGRPVVLIGRLWEQRYPLTGGERAKSLERFDSHIVGRVEKKSPSSPWDPDIAAARRRLGNPDFNLPPLTFLPDGADAPGVVNCLLGLLERKRLPGTFPSSADDDGSNDGNGEQYWHWIEDDPSEAVR